MTFYNGIYYSDVYSDANFDYRHVILPEEVAAKLPKNRLLGDHEWRGLGVVQSIGWEHFMIHEPEPHILIFRRPAMKKFETGKSTGTRSVQNFK